MGFQTDRQERISLKARSVPCRSHVGPRVRAAWGWAAAPPNVIPHSGAVLRYWIHFYSRSIIL